MKLNNEIMLGKAYNELERIILNSEEYSVFTRALFNNQDFKNNYPLNSKEDLETALNLLSNVSDVKDLCDKIGLEKEFCKMILSAVKCENLFLNIIRTKFIETLYGNPLKEDLSNNDSLFTILESVFGLDTIILSFNNHDVLIERFTEIMGDSNPTLIEAFVNVVNNLYTTVKDEKDYNKIKALTKANADEIRPFVFAGLNKQLDEITRDPNGLFDKYHLLYDNVVDILGKANIKNM